MPNGENRALLIQTIVSFPFNQFFSESQTTIELALNDKGKPEIEFNPAEPEKFIHVKFSLVDADPKVARVEFNMKMSFWKASVSFRRTGGTGAFNSNDYDLLALFLDELYRVYNKARDDKAKLESSLRQIIKVHKPKAVKPVRRNAGGLI